MDEEILLEMEAKLPTVAPVFPELRDFDFLLRNKFETWVKWFLILHCAESNFLLRDEHLSKYWELDLLWAYLGHYKLQNKHMEPYKINFTVLNPTGNLNACTIPIHFEKVLMYTHADYRGCLSARLMLLKKEFKKSIATDQFTTVCPSTAEMFDFLEMYNNHVQKTNAIVNNFFSIIRKHQAILDKSEETWVALLSIFTSFELIYVFSFALGIRSTLLNVASETTKTTSLIWKSL